MRIGIVSDSHDNVDAAAVAAAALRNAGVGFVLHAGDVTRADTLALFGGTPGAVAFGNNDEDEAGLSAAARRLGWEAGASWSGRVDGVRVALTHGHRQDVVRRLLDARPDVLVVGHSHRVRDELVDGVRVLNPGALFRARRYSVAVLDAASGAFSVLDVPKAP